MLERLNPEKGHARRKSLLSLEEILDELLSSGRFEESRRTLKEEAIPLILEEIDDYLESAKDFFQKKIQEEPQDEVFDGKQKKGFLFSVILNSQDIAMRITRIINFNKMRDMMYKMEGMASLEYFLIKILLIDPLFPREKVEEIVKKFYDVFNFTKKQIAFIKSSIENYYNQQRAMQESIDINNPLEILEKYFEEELSNLDEEEMNKVKEEIKKVRIEILPGSLLFIIPEDASQSLKEFFEIESRGGYFEKKEVGKIIVLRSTYTSKRLLMRVLMEELFHSLNFDYYYSYREKKLKFSKYYRQYFLFFRFLYKKLFIRDIAPELRKLLISRLIKISPDMDKNVIKDNVLNLLELIDNFWANHLMDFFIVLENIKDEIISKSLSIIPFTQPSPRIFTSKEIINEEQIKRYIDFLKKTFVERDSHYRKKIWTLFVEKSIEDLRNFKNEFFSIISSNEIFLEVCKKLGLNFKNVDNIEEEFKEMLENYYDSFMNQLINSLDKLLGVFIHQNEFSLHAIVRFLTFYPLNFWPFIIETFIIRMLKKAQKN